MTEEHTGVRVTVDGAVATLTLDRPEIRNAQDPVMWAAMADAIRSFDDTVRVVVVRGAGGTFSAGLNLRLLDPARTGEPGNLVDVVALSDEAARHAIGVFQEPFALLADGPFLTVAVVEGHAIGAGFQLALACDLRLAADSARFCMKEPALGLVPDLAGTKPLVEAVGYARALEICATARTVGADEALRLGLVQQCVPAAEVDDALALLVRALTAHDAVAVRETRELLRAAPGRTAREQRLAERTAQVPLLRRAVQRLG